MPDPKIPAKDYSSREELEKYISTQFGQTTDLKKATIVGTAQELKDKKLGYGTMIWGVRVEMTDYVKPPKIERVDRGKIHKFGLSEESSVDITNSEEN